MLYTLLGMLSLLLFLLGLAECDRIKERWRKGDFVHRHGQRLIAVYVVLVAFGVVAALTFPKLYQLNSTRISQLNKKVLFNRSGAFFYSYLRDSIGSSRAAFHAGKSRKRCRCPTLAKKPAIGAHSGT